MKTVKRIIVSCLAVLSAVLCFTACGEEIPYNAILYDNVNSWLNQEFLKENLTNGAWDEVNEQYVQDESIPKTRLFTIKDDENFNRIFSEFSTEVDFETEMILLYGETTSTIREFVIESIELENNVLKVKTKTVTPDKNAPDAASPHVRWTAVKMDQISVSEITFT